MRLLYNVRGTGVLRTPVLFVRIAANLLIALLPSSLKILVYRMFYRYQIGKGVKLGLGVVFSGVKKCHIGDHTRIRHLNLFCCVQELTIGSHTDIGYLNLFRGGARIHLGDYVTIMRCNVFNSILQPDAVNPLEASLKLGSGAVVTTGHWLDFSDRITVGENTIIGGRNSSFWTHNRQRTRPITVGDHCYLGSEIRVAPGVEIAPLCVVALGSVLLGRFKSAPRSLIAGNPASVVRELHEGDLFLVTAKTRKDTPDEDPPSLVTDYGCIHITAHL